MFKNFLALFTIVLIFLAGNILIVANWLAEKGVDEKATWIREEFLTGTAIVVTIALLILLVNPKNSGSSSFRLVRRYPVCDHRLISRGSYCSECGSKV